MGLSWCEGEGDQLWVSEFCCHGDMVDADGGCGSTSVAVAWSALIGYRVLVLVMAENA